jgi:hypothetical protein
MIFINIKNSYNDVWMLTVIDVSPDDKVPNGSIAMDSATEARTTAYAVSTR